MSIYDKSGDELFDCFALNGEQLSYAYDMHGSVVFPINDQSFVSETITKMTSGWKFYLQSQSPSNNVTVTNQAQTAFNDGSWSDVEIPHDWSIHLDFNPSSAGGSDQGFLDGGVAFYRYHFTGNTENKYVVYFDEVAITCEVYINNHLIKKNYTFNPFSADLSEYVVEGDNVITLMVKNTQQSSRYYTGSGILGEAFLITCKATRDAAIGDVKITTPDLLSNINTTRVEFSMSRSARVTLSIKDSNNHTISSKTLTGQDIDTTLTPSTVNRWSPEHPNLYYLEISTEHYTSRHRFGYRSIEWKTDGFYLNGVKTFLKGVALHQDYGCLGSEDHIVAAYRKLKLMKDMGANAVRTAHQTFTSNFIKVCDELGLMCVEEMFDCWCDRTGTTHSGGKAKWWNYNNYFYEDDDYKKVIKSTICRDRNCPSIIMWTIGNEIQRQGQYSLEQAIEVSQQLNNEVKRWDTTRPTCNPEDMPGGTIQNAMCEVVDVIAINYGNDSEYSSMRSRYPNKCMFGSETTSAFATRGRYITNLNSSPDGNDVTMASYRNNHSYPNDPIPSGLLYCSSYDNDKSNWGDYAAVAVKRHMDSNYLAGMFVWTGWDYLGETSPFNNDYPSKSSVFGIVDLAGFPKDIYYMYQSRWRDWHEYPMIHVCPHNLDFFNEGDTVKLMIYSNCPQIEVTWTYDNTVVRKTQAQINQSTYAFEMNIEYHKGYWLICDGLDEDGNYINQNDSPIQMFNHLCLYRMIEPSNNNSLYCRVNVFDDSLYPSNIKFIQAKLAWVGLTAANNFDEESVKDGDITFTATCQSGCEIIAVDNGNNAYVGRMRIDSNRNSVSVPGFAGCALFVVKKLVESQNARIGISAIVGNTEIEAGYLNF